MCRRSRTGSDEGGYAMVFGRTATAHRATRVLPLAGAVLAFCSSASAAVAPSFQLLSTPPAWGTPVEAVGVSADGAVIIGRYFLPTNDPACGVFGGCTRTVRLTAATAAVD